MADTSVPTSSLRGELLKLFRSTRNRKADLAAGDFSQLQAVCEHADELSDRVKTARDNALSSGVFLDLSETGVRRTNKLTQDKDLLTPFEFVSILKSKYVPEGQSSGMMDWKKIGDVAGRTIKCDVGVDCMLGALTVPAKVSAPKRRNRRTTEAEITQPKNVKGDCREDVRVNQQTDKIMEVMYRVLADAKEPIPVVELVLNHESFSQTVENLFTLSFLVKDRRVDFSHDEELGVLVSKRKRNQNQRGQGPSCDAAGHPKRQQGIMAIDWNVFEDMKSIALPENCKMPNRSTASESNPGEAARASRSEMVLFSGDEAPPAQAPVSYPPEGSEGTHRQPQIAPTPESVTKTNKHQPNRKSVLSKKRSKAKAEGSELTPRKARRVLEHSDCLINSPLNK